MENFQIQDAIRAQRIVNERFAKESISYFLENVIIAAQPEPLRFGACAEEWQRQLLAPKIPALEYLAGLNPGYWQPPDERPGNGPLSFMSILARGHDKSSLEGRLLLWALYASKRSIHAYILAADEDQGRLILQAMQDEADLNPWLREHLVFKRKTVEGPAGFVEVLPADAGSAYGLRGNLYVVDEYTNWSDRGRQMWTAVVTGREKIPGTLLIVLSNAGLLDSWQHDIFTRAKKDRDWVVFYQQGQLATWMDRSRVEKLRLLLPPSEGERLYDNKWIDPATEHDYLRKLEILACRELGVQLGLMIRMRREPDVQNYVASIDYGARRDRTALCLQHLDGKRVVRVDRLDVWQGNPDQPVEIPQVEAWIKDVQDKFRPKLWVVDPSNLEGTVQGMETRGLPVERFKPRGGAGNYEMAQHLRSLVVNRQLAWYPGAGDLLVDKGGTTIRETLEDELIGLRVKRMPYGYRFDHENQKHDDRAVALGMGALRVFDYPPSASVLAPMQPVLHPEQKESVLYFPLNGIPRS